MLRNKLRYLVFLAAVGLLAILYNVYYMWIIFLTVLAVPFLMFGLLCYFYGKVRTELVSAAHIVNKGDVVPISVQLNNPTIFPVSDLRIYLVYQNAYSGEQHKKEFVVSVDYRTKTSVTCNLYSEYAGNLIVSLKAVRIYDYLKIFSLKRKQKGEVRAAVLPFYYELMENDFNHMRSKLVESDYYSPYKGGDDPSEVFAIREYREGDRQQRIHWKLSRKQGQLMIKEFSDPLNCSVLLLADLSVPKNENILGFMDATLECVLSLSYTFLQKGQLHYFAWYDKKFGGCRRIRVEREKDLYEAVDGLLHAMPYAEDVDALAIYHAEHPHEQYTDMFYVTGDLSEEKLNVLTIIRAEEKQLIYLNEEEDPEEIGGISAVVMKKSEEMGIHLWPTQLKNIRRDMEQLRIS